MVYSGAGGMVRGRARARYRRACGAQARVQAGVARGKVEGRSAVRGAGAVPRLLMPPSLSLLIFPPSRFSSIADDDAAFEAVRLILAADAES